MKKLILISALLLFSFNTTAKEYWCAVLSTEYNGAEVTVLYRPAVLKQFKDYCKRGDAMVYINSSQGPLTSIANISVRVCDQNKPINVIKETVLVYKTLEERENLLCTYDGIKEER